MKVLIVLLFLFRTWPTSSYVLVKKFWNYKGHPISYEEARQSDHSRNRPQDKNRRSQIATKSSHHRHPILLLNGFGVGSFHQHRLISNLFTSKQQGSIDLKHGYGYEDQVVYGIDYLGQGNSWPLDCDDGNSSNEQNLIYSIDTWADQIIHFIEEVVRPNAHESMSSSSVVKVHLVGNSVGGLLSVLIASKRPDLIESLCLLNATPIWGLNLPGWSGHLPPPRIPRWVGRYLFDRIRDPKTIEKYLETAYSNRDAFGTELIEQIRACTEGKGGHAAFASILWSPPASFPGDQKDFYSNLSKLECDVLLLFGKNDPWCTPSFARRMFLSLLNREKKEDISVTHRYIELDNVGHCPNHEAPQAVSRVIRSWIETPIRHRGALCLVDGARQIYNEPWGDITIREVDQSEVKLDTWEKFLTKLIG